LDPPLIGSTRMLWFFPFLDFRLLRVPLMRATGELDRMMLAPSPAAAGPEAEFGHLHTMVSCCRRCPGAICLGQAHSSA
jgi:hypothetical protein